MSKTRFFFLIIFDCLIILSFSGCPGFDLLFPSVGSGKKPEVGYSNTTSNMDKDGKEVDIEMEEYEEVYSLKKSEIVFVGKSDVKNDSVYFREDFIDLLSEEYIDKFSCGGTLDNLLNYITLYYHSRTHDKSFLERKKIKVTFPKRVEEVIDNVAKEEDYDLMHLHLFSEKDDLINCLFKNYTSKEVSEKDIYDFGTKFIDFENFSYKVQISKYHNYKRFYKFWTIRNNGTILLIYDVNNKLSFDDLNMLIDYFSKNNSKHIFFILGDQSSSAGDVGILGKKSTGACTDSNETLDDNYVSEWCKEKEKEINTADEGTNAEENKVNI